MRQRRIGPGRNTKSLAGSSDVRVQLGLELGAVEPEGSNGVVQLGAVAVVGEFARQDQGGGGQVSADTMEFVKVLHRDDRSDCATAALDDDVLAALSVLDEPRNTPASRRGDGEGPLGMHVSESRHARNCTEI